MTSTTADKSPAKEEGGSTDVESAASARPIGVAAAGPQSAAQGQAAGGAAWEAQQREVEK